MTAARALSQAPGLNVIDNHWRPAVDFTYRASSDEGWIVQDLSKIDESSL